MRPTPPAPPVSVANDEVEMKLQSAANLIRKAERMASVVFTGAGVSADSGISTFRGAGGGGLWSGLTGFLALTYFGTPTGWKLTPGLAWNMYLKNFYAPIAQAQPHDGHHALARLEREKFSLSDAFGLITMNVDGFHSRAGSSRVAELHGTVIRNRCVKHGPIETEEGSDWSTARCPVCKRYPRPDVTLFMEALPEKEWRKAEQYMNILRPGKDVMLIIGTTGTVYPAASLPEAAIRAGVNTIEINLERSPISSSVNVHLRGKAKEMITCLVDLALDSPSSSSSGAGGGKEQQPDLR